MIVRFVILLSWSKKQFRESKKFELAVGHTIHTFDASTNNEWLEHSSAATQKIGLAVKERPSEEWRKANYFASAFLPLQWHSWNSRNTGINARHRTAKLCGIFKKTAKGLITVGREHLSIPILMMKNWSPLFFYRLMVETKQLKRLEIVQISA